MELIRLPRPRVVAVLAFLAVAVKLPAQTFTTLLEFDGYDGQWPRAALVQGADGNLYGTTQNSGCCGNGGGLIFNMSTAGAENVLYYFCESGGDCSGIPNAALVLATDGNFYGITTYAGGYGSVFQMRPAGVLTTLHGFDSRDGKYPLAPLFQASDGDFYGTTSAGGGRGHGTVFKITLDGKFRTMHDFAGNDGARPRSGLVEDQNGTLYGTTAIGGTDGKGTVYKMTLKGALTTIHSFTGKDGADPRGGLTISADGTLYGTAYKGGDHNYGVVFQVTPTGTYAVLHSFNRNDGAWPLSTLELGTDGNFYGTTRRGGLDDMGTVFSVTPTGEVKPFLGYLKGSGGLVSFGGLYQATDGDFYGTNFFGVYQTEGSVFKFSVGLGPFVKTIPRVGVTGTAVTILGTDLAGATGVTFGGTATTNFTINATGTAIYTDVPPGAATGFVQVRFPSGTLTSKVLFRVRQ